MLFLFFPIVIIILYAFNPSNVQSWPLAGLSTRWFSSTWHNEEMRHALWLSVRAGLLATGDRDAARLDGGLRGAPLPLLRARSDLVRCSCCRSRCRGSSPGMALNSFITFNGVELLAADDRDRARDVLHRRRLQQRAGAPAAHADLAGGGLDGPRRGRLADVPLRDAADDRHRARRGRPARVRAVLRRDRRDDFTAGAQNTLPIWIFGNIRLGQQLPQVNVVVLFVILITLIPVTLAQRLTRDTGVLRRAATAAGAERPWRRVSAPGGGRLMAVDPAPAPDALSRRAQRTTPQRDPGAAARARATRAAPGADPGLIEAIGERALALDIPALTYGIDVGRRADALRAGAAAGGRGVGRAAGLVPGQRRLAGQPRGRPRARAPRRRGGGAAQRPLEHDRRARALGDAARRSSRRSSTPSSASPTA